MRPEQKASLVEAVKDTYGLNCAVAAVDLPKSTWYYHQNDKVDYEEKHAHLRPILGSVARKYPEYGLPRIMVERITINTASSGTTFGGNLKLLLSLLTSHTCQKSLGQVSAWGRDATTCAEI